MEESSSTPSRPKIFGPRLRSWWLALGVTLLMAFLSGLNFGQAVEHQVLDLWYRLRPAGPPPSDLLIVAIDEPSFQELKLPWPWPRRLQAQLVQRLAEAHARLIIFDVIFADATTPADDDALAQALKEAGNVILGETFDVVQDPRFSRRILVTPHQPLSQAAKGLGLTMVTPDADGVVRRFRTRLGGERALAAVALDLLRSSPAPALPLTGLINYVGPARSIDTVSFYQVIDAERPLPRERLKNRIVLVGRTLEASATPQSQADTFYTPYFGGGGQLMSGVEIHANIIHTLLTGTGGREVRGLRYVLLLGGISLLVSLLLGRWRPLGGLAVTLGVIFLIFLTSLGLFLQLHLWLPPVFLSGSLGLVYTGHVLGHYFMEAREKRWLRQAFARYVSPSVVETLSAHPERLELGGEEVEVTVLFADLEGFTHISETMSPQDLIRLLNEYFSPMTRIIMAHQGTLDKYIGDAIMALWGAPLALPDHAQRACRTALEMQAAMAELQGEWAKRGLPLLAARVGIHSGPVIAGNVGSRERFNYTVLGDTVNLASRLEGVNKVYGTRILLSQETWHRVKDDFWGREIDLVQVVGRVQPVALYELLGPLPAAGLPAWLKDYEAGRRAYLERRWEEASRAFEAVLACKPGDRPAQIFLERCRRFAAAPPPPEWQGVYVLPGK
uniref:Adenylate/guanylate cyclase domain-containing protein n=1 Tax=Desulfobacca acetoxidans TaxID=60893 RepID=A0A7V4G7M5_9BACT